MSEFADTISEEQLATRWIQRMAVGEMDALNALYRLYHRPLLALLQRMLGDAFVSEEVLQDTFVRAYRNADRFDSHKGSPFAWLVTIGRRIAIDRLRRQRSRISTENWEQAELLEDKREVREEMDAKLELQWMENFIGQLPESQREAIELAFLQGYTHHEIADLLGRPLGSVKSDLYRGLSQLRKLYEEGND